MGEFVPDPAWPHEFLISDDVRQCVDAAGEKVLEAAEMLSEPFRKTGQWEDHLSGHSETADTGRPYYRVQDDRDWALSIEFGTSKMEGKRALGRAIRAAEL